MTSTQTSAATPETVMSSCTSGKNHKSDTNSCSNVPQTVVYYVHNFTTTLCCIGVSHKLLRPDKPLQSLTTITLSANSLTTHSAPPLPQNQRLSHTHNHSLFTPSPQPQQNPSHSTTLYTNSNPTRSHNIPDCSPRKLLTAAELAGMLAKLGARMREPKTPLRTSLETLTLCPAQRPAGHIRHEWRCPTQNGAAALGAGGNAAPPSLPPSGAARWRAWQWHGHARDGSPTEFLSLPAPRRTPCIRCDEARAPPPASRPRSPYLSPSFPSFGRQSHLALRRARARIDESRAADVELMDECGNSIPDG